MNLPSTLSISFSLFTALAFSAHATEKLIYKTDSLGNIQYHKPSHTIQKNSRIIETDSIGNKQYHKQQYQIKGDKIFEVDTPGSIQHHKPPFVIE